MLLAEMVQLDFGNVVSGGGLGVGGFLAGILWRAYKKWSTESDLRSQLMRAQINDYNAQRDHRTAEARHWETTVKHYDDTVQHMKREESDLKRIADDARIVRIRMESGPQIPVT